MGKLRIYGRLFVIVLLAAVLPACSGVKVVTSTVTQPVITGPADSVDIIYFHNTVEWGTCLWFKDSITRVVNDDFSAELSSGKTTFGIYDVDDPKNAALKTKYKAVGPQMFLDIHAGGAESIVNTGDLWSWDCVNNTDGFEQKVRDAINGALNGEI